jgi:hypothetical protein
MNESSVNEGTTFGWFLPFLLLVPSHHSPPAAFVVSSSSSSSSSCLAVLTRTHKHTSRGSGRRGCFTQADSLDAFSRDNNDSRPDQRPANKKVDVLQKKLTMRCSRLDVLVIGIDNVTPARNALDAKASHFLCLLTTGRIILT